MHHRRGRELNGGAVAVASDVTLTLDSATFTDTTLSLLSSREVEIEDWRPRSRASPSTIPALFMSMVPRRSRSIPDSVIVNAGILDATAGASSRLTATWVRLGGAIAASGDESVVQLSGGTITGGSMSIGATGTLSIESGSASLLNDVDLENAGDVQVDAELQATTLISDRRHHNDRRHAVDRRRGRGRNSERRRRFRRHARRRRREQCWYASIDNSATLSLAATIDGGTITNNGLIDITGASTIDDGAVLTGGEIAIQNGQALTLNGATVESARSRPRRPTRSSVSRIRRPSPAIMHSLGRALRSIMPVKSSGTTAMLTGTSTASPTAAAATRLSTTRWSSRTALPNQAPPSRASTIPGRSSAITRELKRRL